MTAALELGLAPWALDADGSTAALEPLAEQAERAERLGYTSLWLPESHFAARGANPAPLLLLAALAGRTRRIRLGTTSYLLTIRNPLLVAEEVAVLDRLSQGRVILGVGRGFRPTLFDGFGLPRSGKRDRFEVALNAILHAWRGDPVGEGEGDPLRLAPRPAQRPHPPVWVAAFGPKALAQAGRLGLPYLASPVETIARLEHNYALHREACPADVAHAELPVPVMRTVFVTRDPSARARVRDALAAQARGLRASRAPALRDAPGEVESWALIGEPAAVADGVAGYRERLGVTHLIARAQVPGAEPDEIAASIELLAELVG